MRTAASRPLESVRITVADVELEHAVVALLAIGSALGVIAFAYALGFLVGRLGL